MKQHKIYTATMSEVITCCVSIFFRLMWPPPYQQIHKHKEKDDENDKHLKAPSKPKWKTGRSWLKYDSSSRIMWCTLCRDFEEQIKHLILSRKMSDGSLTNWKRLRTQRQQVSFACSGN
jgi:hypothetical protein